MSVKVTLDTIFADINATKVLPIGWGSEILPGKPGYADPKSPLMWWLMKIVGLLLTIGAVSLGSTYWYKQLKSLLSLRLGRNADPTPTPGPEGVPPVTAARQAAAPVQNSAPDPVPAPDPAPDPNPTPDPNADAGSDPVQLN